MSPTGHALRVETTCGGWGVLGGKGRACQGGKLGRFQIMQKIDAYAKGGRRPTQPSPARAYGSCHRIAAARLTIRSRMARRTKSNRIAGSTDSQPSSRRLIVRTDAMSLRASALRDGAR